MAVQVADCHNIVDVHFLYGGFTVCQDSLLFQWFATLVF